MFKYGNGTGNRIISKLFKNTAYSVEQLENELLINLIQFQKNRILNIFLDSFLSAYNKYWLHPDSS